MSRFFIWLRVEVEATDLENAQEVVDEAMVGATVDGVEDITQEDIEEE